MKNEKIENLMNNLEINTLAKQVEENVKLTSDTFNFYQLAYEFVDEMDEIHAVYNEINKLEDIDQQVFYDEAVNDITNNIAKKAYEYRKLKYIVELKAVYVNHDDQQLEAFTTPIDAVSHLIKMAYEDSDYEEEYLTENMGNYQIRHNEYVVFDGMLINELKVDVNKIIEDLAK